MSAPLLLIIDDDLAVCKLVEFVGNSVGFNVLSTTTVREFQDMYASHDVDAIVMDIVMPDMDGYELLGWLNERGCTVPVIVISGQGDGYLDKAREIGLNLGSFIAATLSKPLTGQHLSSTLTNILSAVLLQIGNQEPVVKGDTPILSNIPKEMSVGNKKLDTDHLHLFRLIHEYKSILAIDMDSQALLKLLEELHRYTVYHFKREEGLMQDAGYPQFENHRQVHNFLTTTVERILESARHGGQEHRDIKFISFLDGWLRIHIMSMDQHYKSHISRLDQGLGPS